MHSRREFLNGMTLAGTVAFLGVRPPPVAAEPPPETTALRLARLSGACIAPQYVSEELLRSEGFTDVKYVPKAGRVALEPDRVARFLVDRGYATDYDYALQTLKALPYSRWRDADPEDTIRFYGVRLHEAGMIKSSPQKILAQGTDWRFLNELKKELKG